MILFKKKNDNQIFVSQKYVKIFANILKIIFREYSDINVLILIFTEYFQDIF